MKLWLLTAVLALVSAHVTVESAGPREEPGPERQLASIDLDPAIECWYHDEFPTLSALLEPQGEIQHSRLYFRCSSYSDYYFVDLEPTPEGKYAGVGSMADPDCPRVHYYVESVARDFTNARTEERVAEVTSYGACRRRFPAATIFSGEPNIILGSASVGADPSAPGSSSSVWTGFFPPRPGRSSPPVVVACRA